MNLTIANHEMQFVVLHAAVLAKGQDAVVFPAPPGSGKSTLTTYLAFSGWRLMSDEMTLLKPHSLSVTPFVRPICLKNQSIQLAKQWFPDGTFSTIARDTHKGDVIHLSPPDNAWDNQSQQAEIKAIIFPQYQANTKFEVYILNEAQAFSSLSKNAFNYGVAGDIGFKSLVNAAQKVPCFEVNYNNIADLEGVIETEIF
ncbi:HprK-related kinase A [Marinifaba aquimaris]|uniref:HprK-related kinase A n=1 Tax=Marinifaba aquimaris TaxID=2741323 RepID=UPI001FE98E02|nr:HprK-related kinase A [Marinifaba aquimaris]